MPTKLVCVKKNNNKHSLNFELQGLYFFFSAVLQAPQRKSRSLAQSAPLPLLSLALPALQLNRNLSTYTILSRASPLVSVSSCSSFPFRNRNNSFFCRMLAVVAPKHVLSRTIEGCRLDCTVRALADVHRRGVPARRLEKVKIAVSLLERMSSTCRSATSAQLWSPIQFF